MKLLVIFLFLGLAALAQAPAGANYDEAKAGSFTGASLGASLGSPRDWKERQRPKLLTLFTQQIYGLAPNSPVTWTANEQEEVVFAGKAIRTIVDLNLAREGRELPLQLLIYRPTGQGPWPVIVGMNFCGNQSVYPDAGIPLPTGWVSNAEDIGIKANRATDDSRGGRSMRWPIESIVARGYAVCTLCYGDVQPDRDSTVSEGASEFLGGNAGPDRTWGAVAAWAWGLSRVADYLEQQAWVDRMGVMGHSRLGKAALWAGANDPRFGLVISNDSGCAGAALSKRDFGETVRAVNDSFPHWFVTRFRQYNDNEQALPVDQHELLALMADRNLYVASAEADLWADWGGPRLRGHAFR